jgi:hypothetical protein
MRTRLGWAGLGLALLTGSGSACDGEEGTDPPGGDTETDTDTETPPEDTGETGVVLPTDTGDTGDTETTGEPSISASCLPDPDNTLRFDCEVTVSPPSDVEIAFQKSDGTGVERVHTSGRVGSRHTVFLYFLAPEVTYDWVARPVGGVGPSDNGIVTTGALPAIARTRVEVDGTSTAKLLGMVAPCPGGAAIVVDPVTGEVVWYDRMSWNNGGQLEGVSFTEDDTVLGLGSGGIIERSWNGEKILDLAPGVDLPNRVHHDVSKRAGLVYSLFSEPYTTPRGQDVSADGFYVIDPVLGVSWEWRLTDFVTPSVFGSPFVVDWSHANAVWADADLDVIVSFRHLSAILRIEGDPGAANFGQPIWQLSGQEDSDVESDFEILSVTGGETDFYQQHNAHLLPDGSLTVFDNRQGPEISRIIDLDLDEAAGTATITREYPMPGDPNVGHCDYQGGAWRTAAGNPIATCAPNRTGVEFDAATAAVLWTGTVTCEGAGSGYVPRFVPLDQ